MKPSLTILAVINTLGVVQGILTGIALLSIKSGNQRSNRILGLFLILLSLTVFDFVLYDTHLFLILPHLYGFANPVIFLLGPLFYFYAKSLIDPGFFWKKNNFWHFLPFILFFILSLPDYFQGGDLKLQKYLTEINRTETPASLYIIFALINGYLFGYLLAIFRLLWDIKKSDNQTNQTIDPLQIKWLKNLVIAFLGIQILSTIFDFFSLGKGNWTITPFFVAVVVYSISFMGIRQSALFAGKQFKPLLRKYEKSALTDQLSGEILDKLKQLMEQEKIYKDNNLSLPKLARRLAVSPHLLSQVLNQKLGRNFFNFISQQRIEEAKKMLLDPHYQPFNVLEIALEVGFNSVSTFNSLFKKQTGLTPSEFRKQNSSN
jgi:AraC-like DNA-binding protein